MASRQGGLDFEPIKIHVIFPGAVSHANVPWWGVCPKMSTHTTQDRKGRGWGVPRKMPCPRSWNQGESNSIHPCTVCTTPPTLRVPVRCWTGSDRATYSLSTFSSSSRSSSNLELPNIYAAHASLIDLFQRPARSCVALFAAFFPIQGK